MGLFDFNAGANPGDPSSYQGMQLRQRIAEAMLKQGGRKGYPKNLGEGLTAIGDAIGERGQMQALMQMQAKIDAAKGANAPPVTPGPQASADDGTPAVNIAGDATDNAAPVQTASADVPPQAAPVMPSWGAGALAANNLYQPTAAPDDAGETYPQTALAQTGTMSDAPPIGISPARNAIAARPMNSLFPAPGVPQPNPPQAGPDAPPSEVSPASIPPSTLAALQAGSPAEAAGNRPIPTDIPRAGPQLAQATITQPQPLTPQPTPPTQAPGIYDRPLPPSKPLPEPKSRAQFEAEQKALRIRALGGDPDTAAAWEKSATIMEAERARKEAFTMKEYENRLTEHGTADRAWMEAQRNLPTSQAQAAEAQAKALAAKDAAQLTERTGLPAEAVMTKFDGLKKVAEKDAYTIQQLRLAREALDKGIVSGIGGNFRLDLERAKAFFGNKSADELAARSQLYLAAVNSTVGNALQNLQPGDTRVTNSDVIVARGMMGGDPTLQKAAQDKLLGVQMGDVHKRLNEYEDLKDKYLGGLKPEKFYDVKVDPVHGNPDVAKAWVDKLIKNQESYAARERFDKEFGPGAAELEIGRARRRSRLGQ